MFLNAGMLVGPLRDFGVDHVSSHTASGSPSRTNRGEAVQPDQRKSGTKKQREFTQADVDGVIVQLAQ
ncbi:hypothetical protein HHL24_21380 [Paraburkholderia sp. RP-4-7]|uniref:Uncharacterized protein n=1 Tax=Paraburkholderia polaris TaxID=2728848 RepID=A0A848IDG8_9BURK|nr:hypothetical protein [Paraburkholderia polaris]NMM00478.1 hypothetical protein [Paraburkholderia polaris]